MPSERTEPQFSTGEDCSAAVLMECELPAGHDGPHYTSGHGPMQWDEPDVDRIDRRPPVLCHLEDDDT